MFEQFFFTFPFRHFFQTSPIGIVTDKVFVETVVKLFLVGVIATNFAFFRIFLFRGISLFLGGRFTTSRSSSFCSGVFLSLRIRILIRTAVFRTLFGLDFASSWTFASRLFIVFAIGG